MDSELIGLILVCISLTILCFIIFTYFKLETYPAFILSIFLGSTLYLLFYIFYLQNDILNIGDFFVFLYMAILGEIIKLFFGYFGYCSYLISFISPILAYALWSIFIGILEATYYT